jgi:two-component system chemotaxis response regulator CheY
MKILIVDDSKPILSLVSDMLNDLGHTPVTAIDGEDAYKVIAENSDIDLILLDWNMPNMTGIEFLEKNKAESIFTIPVMMMTTENEPSKIQRALETGAVDYIMKPFTADIIQNKIEMLEDLLC